MYRRSYARGNEPAWRQSAGVFRHGIHALIAVLALCAPIRPAGAQTSADAEEQRRRVQREAEERAARQQAPEVRLPRPAPAEDVDVLDLPAEEPCFRIERIRLEGQRVEKFAALQTYLNNYTGRCIGKNGLDRIVKRASGRIIAAGYITTRLGIPEQDLGSGTLRITLGHERSRAPRPPSPSMPKTAR
ncbi:MAG: POTRA domain-containing protein [Rhodocyclaceae bacterium]|nr:POTRA domain-containing protein [Rhodocyclaceae bacterium]